MRDMTETARRMEKQKWGRLVQEEGAAPEWLPNRNANDLALEYLALHEWAQELLLSLQASTEVLAMLKERLDGAHGTVSLQADVNQRLIDKQPKAQETTTV